MFNERRVFWTIYAVLAALAVIGVVVGVQAGSLTHKKFTTADVLRLLATFAVLALFVERTIEVTVGAWRGQVTEKLFSTAENAKFALLAAPSNFALHQTVAAVDAQLIDYRAATKKVALRAAVVMGLLLAATGLRTLETLVDTPTAGGAARLFRLLDLLITASTIGGGSEAVHKMMSAVTTYLDAAAGQFRARGVEAARSTAPVAVVTVPPVTPGPPVR